MYQRIFDDRLFFLNLDDEGSLGNADQQQGDVLTTSSDVMMIAAPLAIAGVVVAGGDNTRQNNYLTRSCKCRL